MVTGTAASVSPSTLVLASRAARMRREVFIAGTKAMLKDTGSFPGEITGYAG
jgi:hypothetical protein